MDLPCYPGLIFWLSLKDESASSSVSSGGLTIRRSRGTSTIVLLVRAILTSPVFVTSMSFWHYRNLCDPFLLILRNLRVNIAEGSNHEELEAIIKRLQSKQWNLKEQSDSLEFATLGRDLAHWARTSSASAVTPYENVEISLCVLNRMVEFLRIRFQHRIAKPMLQNLFRGLLTSPAPSWKESVCQFCWSTSKCVVCWRDNEEKINCCT